MSMPCSSQTTTRTAASQNGLSQKSAEWQAGIYRALRGSAKKPVARYPSEYRTVAELVAYQSID